MRQIILKTLSCVLMVALIAATPAEAARRHKKRVPKGMSARSAILINADTNQRYFGRDIDRQVFPASTTKVLTALVVLERLPLDAYVPVDASAVDVQPTKLGIRPGEQYTVRDLLYAVLLKSANDASIVLAQATAGSQEKFVDLMNQKARDLGAVHSRFANPHGLPSNKTQYTTASDMALIFKAALKNPFFKTAIRLKYQVIYSKEGRRLFLKSHNKSLFLNWKKPVYGKTGFTQEAQSCFVGYVTKDFQTMIVAVFGCKKRWDDIKFIVERFGKIDL